ncbi:MAG: hypothetical protein C4575_01225 [Desulforudis sp.]|nr:MAG: hypothetical protein C4575_01225 [Desulforudis sp.]
MTGGLNGFKHEQIYHVIIEGSKEAVFKQQSDYETLLKFLDSSADREGLLVLAYLLMPDHVHLVVRPHDNCLFSPNVRSVEQWCIALKRFAPALENHRIQRIQGYNRLTSLIRYLRLEPVKAGLAPVPEAYRWFGEGVEKNMAGGKTHRSKTMRTVAEGEYPASRKTRGREVRMNLLLKAVCDRMQVSPQQIRNPGPHERSREARGLFIYVARYSLSYPIAVIGRFLGVSSAFIVRSLAHTEYNLEQDPEKAAAWQRLVSELYLATMPNCED